MDASHGRVMMIILVATVLFFVGRRFQRTMDIWAGWGKAVKAAAEAAAKVPEAKSSALSAAARMIVVGLLAMLFLVLVVKTVQHL
ncbi:hypothetical protein GCM10009677_64330 [Sphaerisporangium rubeum]|uniref:Uncharacterized protein n=1 Tax=Sphaerisporangium rubeum TaxID=321317 RepID=A0A7X0IEW7_9ACTN|nr:hypothetical protein [Sphaerisporangium rubeum]MBB6472407.1 hypothetical protein [Sphaerisporangium rubeum]